MAAEAEQRFTESGRNPLRAVEEEGHLSEEQCSVHSRRQTRMNRRKWNNGYQQKYNAIRESESKTSTSPMTSANQRRSANW